MAPPVCGGCLQKIEARQLLKCVTCLKQYDLLCSNMTEKRFNAMSIEQRKNWKCQECVSKKPKVDNTNTPVKQDINSEIDSCNVTSRSRPHPNVQCTTPSPRKFEVDESISSELITELRLLRHEMKSVRTQMQEFGKTVSDLTTALNLCNKRIDELSTRVDAVEKQQLKESAVDPSELSLNIEKLSLEINERDQDTLSNDIEVAGIPEEKNERAIHLVLNISTKLGVALEERDIVSAERAGAVRGPDTQSGNVLRPRPLVVRLARRTQRDQLLAAARVRRGITTAGLGVGSDTHRLYVNERLTKINRQLFYKARSESLRVHWKYVWTRDGKIFARKEHGAPKHRLRCESDLIKVFG